MTDNGPGAALKQTLLMKLEKLELTYTQGQRSIEVPQRCNS